jgi:streptomycin 6-kinase
VTLDEWKEQAPRLAEECAELWSLRLGEPWEAKHSFVAPAGADMVLKVSYPHPEAEREADALAHWNGRGAVRVFAHDAERWALLLERCVPGTSLWELDEEEALRVAAGVLRRLWRPPNEGHRFDLLAEVATRWASELADLDPGLVRELVSSQGELVVCHQDFHGGNVLRAQREPWLAIDPKPLVGEREFDTAALMRDRQPIVAASVLRLRLDLLSAELGLDRERMRLWGIVHAVAWEHPEVSAMLRL